MKDFSEFINITVSVPRSFYGNSPDVHGNQQVVPNNEFEIPSYEYNNSSKEDQFDKVEKQSFYNDFFDCIKTPEHIRTENYRVSTAGELKRLKQASEFKKGRDVHKKTSPWRLIIQEEDIITSSPVLKKPESAHNLYEKDANGFVNFLQKVGWTTGIIAG